MRILLFQYFQYASLLVAIFYKNALQKFSLSLMIPLLAFACIIETLGVNYKLIGWRNNYTIYNLYIVISPIFQLLIYAKMLQLKKQQKQLYLLICIVSYCFVFINFFAIQGFQNINSLSIILIELLNIFLSSLLLLKIALQNTNHSILKEPYTLICSANLLFGLGTMVILGLQNYIVANKLQIQYKSLYVYIMPLLNIVLYLSYTAAFILCNYQTKNNSLQSS